MKRISIALTPSMVLLFWATQVSGQVYVKLTDCRVPVVQELSDGQQAQSDESFDPFAQERPKLPDDSEAIDEIRPLDLGLDEEPDLGNEVEELNRDLLEEDAEEQAEEALEAERDRVQTSRPRVSIEEYLRPINSLNAIGQTDLIPERGGVNFPNAVQPPIRFESPRSTWAVSNVKWQKPVSYHRQLYFEDSPLERCGIQAGQWKQNIISGAKFYGDAIVLPIRRVQQPRGQVYKRSEDRFSDPYLFGR